MAEIVNCTTPKSQPRYERTMKDQAFDLIRDRKLIETTAEDFLAVMREGGNSTNFSLRRLHNLALGLGWLSAMVLAPKLWPRIATKERREITREEHEGIVNSERNEDRRLRR